MSISRREWMLASLCWSELLAARPLPSDRPYRMLTAAEATALRALTNAILPETDSPGAEQARTVEFIDIALAGYDRDQLALYRRGMADLTVRTRHMDPRVSQFSELTQAQRITLLAAIDQTEFFAKVRTHTVLAYFTNPEFGWKLLGRDPGMHFSPPFGFYDAEGKSA